MFFFEIARFLEGFIKNWLFHIQILAQADGDSEVCILSKGQKLSFGPVKLAGILTRLVSWYKYLIIYETKDGNSESLYLTLPLVNETVIL